MSADAPMGCATSVPLRLFGVGRDRLCTSFAMGGAAAPLSAFPGAGEAELILLARASAYWRHTDHGASESAGHGDI